MSFPLFAVLLLILVSGCVSKSNRNHQIGEISQPRVVDAGCGQCLMGLKDKKGCDLAVTLDGKSYFVDGFTMRQLGDAHADDGMCNMTRKAEVTGDVQNGRFVASTFKLLPASK